MLKCKRLRLLGGSSRFAQQIEDRLEIFLKNMKMNDVSFMLL